MDIYFNCIYCDQTLAIADDLIGEKFPCPDCNKILVVPTASTECVCVKCNKTLLTIPKMLGEEVTCLACNQKTVLTKKINSNESEINKMNNSAFENFSKSMSFSNFHIEEKTSLFYTIVNYDFFQKSSKYNYVLAGLSFLFVLCSFLKSTYPEFHSWFASLICFCFWAMIVLFGIFHVAVFLKIEKINDKLNKKSVEMPWIQDMILWHEDYTHVVSKIWNYALFPLMLILFVKNGINNIFGNGYHGEYWYLLFGQLIVLCIFQLSRFLMLVSIKTFSEDIEKFQKNERSLNFHKEINEVATFTTDKFGKRIET